MRRIAFGLFSLAAAGSLLLFVGCTHDNALRIVSINEDQPVMSDLVDFGELRLVIDPEEPPEIIELLQTPEDIVKIELQYLEYGLGLPTWTPYTAQITNIKVRFAENPVAPPIPLEFTNPIISLPANITVESDVTGDKTTEAYFSLVPARWKDIEFVAEGYAQDSREDDEYGAIASLKATVTVEGIDAVHGEAVTAVSDVDVVIGNFYDDPDRLGQ